MGSTISAFFQSFFPSTRAPASPAPTKLVSERRAAGDAQGPASVNPHHTPSHSSPCQDEAPMATSSPKTNDDNDRRSGPGFTSKADADEIRRLRAQFLDSRFGAPGTKGGRNRRARPTS
ncbi:uncharacterized protein PG998_001488 [Apiospora kogelbergensis]|uniref:Uncharacterized protein n=1 Tax=Apiospora kogelbergensis TaxID=1337665 RepID=A0AAW0QPI3_9PEZI